MKLADSAMAEEVSFIRIAGRQALIYLLLTIAGLTGGVVVCELYARLALRREARWLDRWSFRATQPPPYAGAAYFSGPFIQEAARSVAGLSSPPGKNQLILADFSGHWMHVRNTRRVTTHQPLVFQNRIYLFGGSAVFGQEVPDDLTIASYLQRIVNEAMPGRFRIENIGVPAVIAVQQGETLKSLPLEPGDKVIFYDGTNDVTYGVYYMVPMGWRPGQGFPMVRQASPLEKLLVERLLGWQPRLASLQLLQGRIDSRSPAHLADAAAMEALGELLARQRTTALLDANSTARRSGADFFAFVQPNIFSLPSQTHYRQYVIQNPLLTPPGLELAFRHASPVVSRVRSWLRTAGVRAADLSGVLTAISNSQEVYFDYVHVNHVANEAIAREVFRQVFRTRWDAAPSGGETVLRARLGRYEGEVLPVSGSGHQFFRAGQRIYAVPERYGHLWWDGVDVAALPGVITGRTVEEVVIASGGTR